MALANEKEVLEKALSQCYAVGAFNFSTIEIMNGILDAASELRSPVILATSQSEFNHMRPENAAALVRSMAERLDVPVVIHLDHGKSFDIIKRAIDCGYNAVHFDGSQLPLNENREQTKQIVDYAHDKGIHVEAEVGHVKGGSDLHQTNIGDVELTDPTEAKEFVEYTGCDALAISIGNAHGIYTEEPQLDMERLCLIREQVNVPLVLHGGSGIPPAQIREALKHGIAKINVNTENRLAYATAVKEILESDPSEIVPYKMNQNCAAAVSAVTKEKINLFQSAGRV